MKKIVQILCFILILLLCNFTKSVNTFPLVVSFSLSLIIFSIFSTLDIKTYLLEYQNKKKYNLRDKLLISVILAITIISIIISLVIYFISNLMNINNLVIVDLFMCLFVYTNTIFRVVTDYLEVLSYKKLTNIIKYIYYIGSIITGIIIILTKIDTVKYIYLNNIGFFFLLIIPISILLIKKKKKYPKINKVITLKEIKKVLISKREVTTTNIIKSSYLYISIIILYYTLINKYNYNYKDVSVLTSEVYLYGIVIIYYIYLLIKSIYIKDYNNLKEKIINKDKDISLEFNKLFSIVLRVSLPIITTLIIISGPLCLILLGDTTNTLFILFILLFFYIIYDLVIDILINISTKKTIFITLIIGLILKVISEIPLISTVYRMGYNLYFGSVISIILGLILSIVVGVIIIKNKLKITLLDNFDNVLNIIYENIILCFILILFTLIIKVNTKSILTSILTIISYLSITIIFHIIKNILTKKRV